MDCMRLRGALIVNVQKYAEDAGSHFGLTVGADDVPALATALRRAGHAVDGYALEASCDL
jgi:hypothetical protein